MTSKNVRRLMRNDYDQIVSTISEDDTEDQPKHQAKDQGSKSKSQDPPKNSKNDTKTTKSGSKESEKLKKKPSRVDIAMEKEVITHPTYSSKFEGLMALLSFVICSSNFWLFPFYCVVNGGWFPIQFTICFLIISVPLLYMEISLGQYASASPLFTFSQMVPAMAGLSAGMTYLLVFRMILQAIWTSCDLSVWFIIVYQSITREIPEWTTCLTENCMNYRLAENCTWIEYGSSKQCDRYQNYILRNRARQLKIFPFLNFLRTWLFDTEPLFSHWSFPSLHVCLAALVVWTLVTLLSIGGYRALSKSGCLILVILFISHTLLFSYSLFSFSNFWPSFRALFGGAQKTGGSFMRWIWSWADAATCALRAVNVGCGGVQKFASLNRFSQKIKYQVLIVSAFAYLTYITIAIYSFMYLAELGRYYYPDVSVEERINIFKSPGTLFSGISEVLTNATGSMFWLTALWIAMPLMGVQGIAAYLWIITSLVIEKINARNRAVQKPTIKWKHRALIVLCISALSFLSTLPLLVKSAVITVVSIESYAAYGTLFIAFFEICTVSYFYGFKRFVVNIRTMEMGGKSIFNVYWWLNWVVLSPGLLLCMFFAIIFTLQRRNRFFQIEFPLNWLGWMMMFTAIIFVFAYFLREEILRRKNREPLAVLFRPAGNWGPADAEQRKDAQRAERAARVRY